MAVVWAAVGSGGHRQPGDGFVGVSAGSGGRSRGEPADGAPKHRLKSATHQGSAVRRGQEGMSAKACEQSPASHRNSVRGHRREEPTAAEGFVAVRRQVRKRVRVAGCGKTRRGAELKTAVP